MRRPVGLSERLMHLARLVPPGSRVCDVGTDHARLPVFLVEQGVCKNVLATDIGSGPLERAAETIRRHRLEEKVILRQCDGLSGVLPEEADTVVIAGMGGDTIAGILAGSKWPQEAGHRFILQPATRADALRGYLYPGGYMVERETVCRDHGRLYATMLARRGKGGPMSPCHAWASPALLREEDPLAGVYLERQIALLRRAVPGLEVSSKPNDRERLQQVREALEGLEEMQKEWRDAHGT